MDRNRHAKNRREATPIPLAVYFRILYNDSEMAKPQTPKENPASDPVDAPGDDTALSDEERTTARRLARHASDFFRSALAADNELGRDRGFGIFAPAPVIVLIAISIELGLKAFLRHQGVPLKELSKLGHDLEKCWRVAVGHGLYDHVELTEVDIEVLGTISDLHRSGVLRNIKLGFQTVPIFEPLQELTGKILDAVCPLVGYDKGPKAVRARQRGV